MQKKQYLLKCYRIGDLAGFSQVTRITEYYFIWQATSNPQFIYVLYRHVSYPQKAVSTLYHG